MKPKIISLGFAAPEQAYTQEDIFSALGYPKHFWKLFRDSGIEKRHFWIPLAEIRKLTFQEQQEEYQVGALVQSAKAILQCLDDRIVEDIGCLVFSSCTGFCPGPTIAHYLAKIFHLAPDTYLCNIASMGCESGFPGLKRAYDFTMTTGKPSLVVTCELSSCSYFPEPDGKPDPKNHFELLRSNAIFGDAAIILSRTVLPAA